ncbi:T9SS type A sorting domain-containing protein [Flavobacterium sp.]|uniref:T9SS type A sorting domain-containing protein n=1 Tax=Flavobacterium sp. TaxID=239 RepID=UPI003B9C9ACE
MSIPLGSGTQTIKFPITIVQTFADVSASVIPYQAPRAGDIGKLKVQIKNNGNGTATGTLSFQKPNIATINNVSPSVQLNTTGFSVDYANLLPNEIRSYLVTYSIPPIPQVNIDDVLTSSAQVSNSNDAFINDNNASLEQIVVAAYDPNDKQEKHGGSIEFASFSENDYLEYTIRFQNTGTANAINVRIEDILGPQYNLESLRMISASHTYYMQRIGNEVKWFFDFIQLPGAVQSPAESIGYLTFKIKLNPGFTMNDVITNTAAIYFDTNPPIITNTHTTVFFENLSVNQPLNELLQIYPNPAKTQVFFNLPSETIESIEIYDLTGKCVVKKSVNDRQFELNTANLSRGFYLVKVRTTSGIELSKKLAIN